MNRETDPLLEVDRLDELLETPAPAQPVVVVQYRNRGIPAWVFVAVLLAIPASFFVYHRMVVEKYRVQAAQANSLLEREIQVERASLPLVRNDPPPTTVLPQPLADATPVAAGPLPAPAVPTLVTPAIARSDQTAASGTVAAAVALQKQASESLKSTDTPAAGAALALAGSPEKPDQTPRMTMRSVFPNPFADPAAAPRPPGPSPGGGPPPAVTEKSADAQPAAARTPLDQPPGDRQPKRDLVNVADKSTSAVVPAGDPAVASVLPPLPTREESERQIREEAAMRQAEILAQNDRTSAEMRIQRFEEQLKFHEELDVVVRSQGNRAGPEIDSLAKRYGYEFDRDKFSKAHRIWHSRLKQSEKVRAIRALEMPETVILNFLSDDIHPQVMARNGVRTASEARVLAAKQLLKYALTRPAATEQPGTDAGRGAAAPGSSVRSRKVVISTPR